VNLSKNSISMKIQRIVFGPTTDRPNNLCSHFWITLFCFVSLPLSWPYSLFKKMLGMIRDKLDDARYERGRMYRARGRALSQAEVLTLLRKTGLIRYYYGLYRFNNESIQHLFDWGGNTPEKIMLASWRGDITYNLGEEPYEPNWDSVLQFVHDHVKELNDEIKRQTESKEKLTATGIRRIFFSYLPAIWVGLTLGCALYVTSFFLAATGSLLFVFVFHGFAGIMGSLYYYPWDGSRGSLSDLAYRYGKRPEDDIVVLYLKAVKGKMCPLINWVD